MSRFILLVGLCCVASLTGQPSRALDAPPAAAVPARAQEQAYNPQQEASRKERKKKIKPKNERTPAAAAVTSTRNITRASLSQRSADGYSAELVIMDSGHTLRSPQDLQMIGSSGSQISDGSRIIFENFVLPFEGIVRFKSPNKMNTVIYERVVNFKINEPGRWVVRVDI